MESTSVELGNGAVAEGCTKVSQRLAVPVEIPIEIIG